MGKLVQFTRRVRRPREASAAAGAAEIVLFTGVRYEREPEAVPPKPVRAARAKRKRG